jgi:hypothetical protein
MEDLSWEMQIARIRREYEDEITVLRNRIEELEAYVARIDEAAQNAIEALRATGSAWPMNAGKALKKAMQDAADLKRSP